MNLIGNENIFKQLGIAIKSAIAENKSLPHTLLSGAAGCGKTSTAKFVAETSGCSFLQVPPESIQIRNDILVVREQLNREGYNTFGDKVSQIRPTVIFIDEIHRLKVTGQEHLGLAMEEWTIPIGEKQAKTNSHDKFGHDLKGRGRWCPRFTLIGATTNDGLLSKPFKDRFKLRFVFSAYSLRESIEIIKVHAERLNKESIDRLDNRNIRKIMLTYAAVLEISKRGRGVPRTLVGLLERCRDMAISYGEEMVDELLAKSTFQLMNIDETGLTSTDINIMKALYENRENPIGLDNIAIIVNESQKVIMETVEPYLIQRNLISRAPRGRILTERGRMYLMEYNHIQDAAEDYIDIPLTYERSI